MQFPSSFFNPKNPYYAYKMSYKLYVSIIRCKRCYYINLVYVKIKVFLITIFITSE